MIGGDRRVIDQNEAGPRTNGELTLAACYPLPMVARLDSK
jgi:hypothetical protein